MVTAYNRGHLIIYTDRWRYEDNLVAIEAEDRACAFCGQKYIDGNIDPCIGRLAGVVSACCGHGGITEKIMILAAALKGETK